VHGAIYRAGRRGKGRERKEGSIPQNSYQIYAHAQDVQNIKLLLASGGFAP